jgi:thioredoxin 1
MAATMTLTTTDASFDTDTAEGLTLVDFWAPWCAPCRAIAPILDQVASEYEGRLTVAKVNVDDNPESAYRFGVQSIPTLLLFANGDLVDRIVGAGPKAQLVARIQAHL